MDTFEDFLDKDEKNKSTPPLDGEQGTINLPVGQEHYDARGTVNVADAHKPYSASELLAFDPANHTIEGDKKRGFAFMDPYDEVRDQARKVFEQAGNPGLKDVKKVPFGVLPGAGGYTYKGYVFSQEQIEGFEIQSQRLHFPAGTTDYSLANVKFSDTKTQALWELVQIFEKGGLSFIPEQEGSFQVLNPGDQVSQPVSEDWALNAWGLPEEAPHVTPSPKKSPHQKNISLMPFVFDDQYDHPIDNSRAFTWNEGEEEKPAYNAVDEELGTLEYRRGSLMNSHMDMPNPDEQRILAFGQRFLNLKRHPEAEKNDTLQMGLEVLRALLTEDRQRVLSLDNADKPEIIAKMIKGFVAEKWDTTIAMVLHLHENERGNLLEFEKRHNKLRDPERARGLQVAYITQIVLFALHILLYDYQIISHTSFSSDEGTSAMIMTKSASAVRISPNDDQSGFREVYERISLRDNSSSKKVIDVRDENLNGRKHVFLCEGVSLIGTYPYNTTQIVAVKNGGITPEEESYSEKTSMATWTNEDVNGII